LGETAVSADLARVEQALSAMMELGPDQWNLAEVKAEARRILSSARSAPERGPARRLVEKIDQLERFQIRHAQISRPGGPPGTQLAGQPTLDPIAVAREYSRATSSHPSPPPVYPTGPVTVVESLLSSPSPMAGDGLNSSGQTIYDGVGTLRPVISRRGGEAPRFALVDGRGRVVTFLSAASGVDLHAFVGQTVGVTGSRAFVPQLRRDHLTAERITSLDGPQRR
jgi:hypothetical protein